MIHPTDCQDCRYLIEERAAIHEFDGKLPREEAERLAVSERCTAHKTATTPKKSGFFDDVDLF